ncbi:histone deacetylase complex subunit SAP18-like [Tupaia chinensis]|uniref:histone deacetylase complex subunit SAP18-like n=1 Tax=Tupaia chinensis TaxID=246437 RepID=UPI000703D974|nr:histone deacetylase complex subunit SAP18-like [Tupaia chinensis]
MGVGQGLMLSTGIRGQGELLRGHRRKMAVELRLTPEEIQKEPEKPIGRRKTCPLLLWVFTTSNGQHDQKMDKFSYGNVPSSELHSYTWMDAILKELTSFVKDVYPETRKKGTRFNFAIFFFFFTDLKRPGYQVKDIGSTTSGRKGTDDSMTLQSQKFQIGSYLDIAMTPPSQGPPPSGVRSVAGAESGERTPESPEQLHHRRSSYHHTLGGDAAAAASPSHHHCNREHLLTKALKLNKQTKNPLAKSPFFERNGWKHLLGHCAISCKIQFC